MTMALLIECPQCRKRISLKKSECGCGKNIRKTANKCYWIEYYVGGKRRRERIGRSKKAAENRLREIQTAKAEEKYIQSAKGKKLTLEELCGWYKQLPEFQQLASYRCELTKLKTLQRILGKARLVRTLKLDDVLQYRKQREREQSPSGRAETIQVATINREFARLKHIIHKAFEYGKIEQNPCQQ